MSRRMEAWGHRDPENEWKGFRGFDPPHLVEWTEAELRSGRPGIAMCGKPISPQRLYVPGQAEDVGVKVCPACKRAARVSKPATARRAPVVDIGQRRVQRGLW